MGRREEVFSDENLRNPYILSFIVDIMDQSHCVLPWDGTQSSFSDPLKQMIIGVKEHEYGVHLFPCIDTISKGANLTIQERMGTASTANRSSRHPRQC